MLLQNRPYIQSELVKITNKKPNVNWLNMLNIQADKVADFGCQIGGETLALMWLLGASEGVGLDISENHIQRARDDLDELNDAIRDTWQSLQYYSDDISEVDKIWWYDSVPNFLKRDLASKQVTFLVQDITLPTGLQREYYDVAFCNYVLHHIWLEEREDSEMRTVSAIREMARVVNKSGFVAICERFEFPDTLVLEFRKLFRLAELTIVHEEERDGIGKYVCRKSG